MIMCSDYVVSLKAQIVSKMRHLNPGMPLFSAVDQSRLDLTRHALIADHETSLNRGKKALEGDKRSKGFSTMPLNFFEDDEEALPKTSKWIKNFVEDQEFIQRSEKLDEFWNYDIDTKGKIILEGLCAMKSSRANIKRM